MQTIFRFINIVFILLFFSSLALWNFFDVQPERISFPPRSSANENFPKLSDNKEVSRSKSRVLMFQKHEIITGMFKSCCYQTNLLIRIITVMMNCLLFRKQKPRSIFFSTSPLNVLKSNFIHFN